MTNLAEPVSEERSMELESGWLATESPDYRERESVVGEVRRALEEALGAPYVSADPEILSAYSRDFTITPQRRPNVVALPGSTADVQQVVRIANRYRVPVYVLTSGFNHAGSFIPRRGGIMVDLKRMTRILRIDEESMTATFEPYVRIAVLYEECSKRFACEDISLRPANAITYGSACMMSNVLSGGVAFIALRSGSHAESVVSMTFVTPDGEILRTGPPSLPNVGDVPVLGPGPDVAGMFLAAEGNFGICTEMTIRLYTENPWPRDKIFLLQHVDDKEEGLKDVADLFYAVSRENFAQALYKGSNRHSAQIAAASDQDVDTLLESLPATIVYCVLTGLEEEEIAIKKKRLDEILEANGKFVEMPDFAKELFFETMGKTEEEINRYLVKRCYTGPGRVGRWKGSFQWMAYVVKMEKVPELEKKYRAIVNRYWIPTDYYGSPLATTTETALQGPYQYGRTVMLEYDFFYDQGNPEEVKRAAVVYEKLHRMMIDSGAISCKVVSRALELQMPKLGTYFRICKKLKKTMDPNGIFSPDTMPILEDSL